MPKPDRKSLTLLAICNGTPEEAKAVYSETISLPSTGQRMLAVKQPIGVVGTITPWNFLGLEGCARARRRWRPAARSSSNLPNRRRLLQAQWLHSARRPAFGNLICACKGDAVGRTLISR
nr:aldehyde dehydrogenase family protein [Mesorhizobium sanjuanii]